MASGLEAATQPAAAAAGWRSPIGCTHAAVDGDTTPAFRAWCDKEAVLWPKCGIAELPATGRGVVALQDIAEGEVVVEVRHRACSGAGAGELQRLSPPSTQLSCTIICRWHALSTQHHLFCGAQVPDDAVLMAENCSIAGRLAGITAPQSTCCMGSGAIAEDPRAQAWQNAPMIPLPSPTLARPLVCADAGLTKPADALFEVQGLVLAVMHERALGPHSRWAPYLAFLPECMDHMLVYWQVRGRRSHQR